MPIMIEYRRFQPQVSTMRCIALLLALLACPIPATAQDITRHQDIEREIMRMRQLLRDGKLVLSHVRLRVRLKNGNKIQGVVKNGRLIEKVDGLHFVSTDSMSRGAGIRLWYYDNTNSYIFLPFATIASYRVGERLSSHQILAIERKIDVDRKATEDARKAYLARKEAERRRRAGEEETGDSEDEAQRRLEELARAAEENRLLALLDEFPPEDGWGENKVQEIEVLRVTVGVFPDEKDKRFLEIFSDWLKALELRKAKENLPPTGLPG